MTISFTVCYCCNAVSYDEDYPTTACETFSRKFDSLVPAQTFYNQCISNSSYYCISLYQDDKLILESEDGEEDYRNDYLVSDFLA